LIFDFLNHRTGQLDPSYVAIARKAGVCVRAVATALARLRDLGNAPVRRELARGAVRAGAAHQCLRCAAGRPQAAAGGATRHGQAAVSPCRYFFAAPSIEPEAVLLCPDCAAAGTRTVLHHDGGTPAP
jgi:hypothetical protein